MPLVSRPPTVGRLHSKRRSSDALIISRSCPPHCLQPCRPPDSYRFITLAHSFAPGLHQSFSPSNHSPCVPHSTHSPLSLTSMLPVLS